MKLFNILDRYPLLGLLVCAFLLIIVSIPKAYKGAQFAGVLPGGSLIEGKVSDLAVEERTGRRGRTVQDCYVLTQTADHDYKVRIECADFNLFDAGQDIQLIEVDGEVEVASHPFSGYQFDLILVLVEIAGLFYFGRKVLKARGVSTPAHAVQG